MMSSRSVPTLMSVQLRRAPVRPPGRERHLEALHDRQRTVDAIPSAVEVALLHGDPGAGFPGGRLPGALDGRQCELEKTFGL